MSQAKPAFPYILRQIRPDEAEAATRIEAICFPPEEACTLPIMRERIARAADCYLVAIDPAKNQMIGFINGLCTDGETLCDDFFTDAANHVPTGKNIMICSVSVLPEYRLQGIAKAMMQEFLLRQKALGRKKAILTCVPGKISMYEKFGYTDRGLSASTWGGETWHEMVYEL